MNIFSPINICSRKLLLNKHCREPFTQIKIDLRLAHLPLRILIQNLLIQNLHFRSLNGTQVKITVQLVSIVEKRVMSFQSVLQDKETKRQKARRPSRMLSQRTSVYKACFTATMNFLSTFGNKNSMS